MFEALLQRYTTPESLWRDGNFLRLFLATTLTVLGTAVTHMALPLTAVQMLQASATEMGVLVACQLLPFVTVGLPAGVWIDRGSKRRIAILFDVFAALGLVLVPLGAIFGFLSMPVLCVVGFMVSTTEAIGGSALQAFITGLVGRERLVLANSKLSAASSAALVAGPALAALLVAWVGAPLAVTADALSFLCSAALLARIRHQESLPQTPSPGVWPQVREGLLLVWRTPVLRAMLWVVATWIILNDGFKALYVLRASRDLGLDAGHIALINTLGALGGLAGAPLAHRLERRLGMRTALVCGILVAGLGYLGFALPRADWVRPEWAAGLALFVVDCGAAIYVITYLSLRQAASPDAALGRVVTGMRFLSILPGPLGTILIGLAADTFGLATTIAGLGAVCLCLGGLASRLVPDWRPQRGA